jgi:hypothetical protein
MYAVVADTPCTSRKSSESLPGGGVIRVHRRPPSVVRSTVPALPLAHATPSFTALTPRRLAVLPLGCNRHGACAVTGPARRTLSASTTVEFGKVALGRRKKLCGDGAIATDVSAYTKPA